MTRPLLSLDESPFRGGAQAVFARAIGQGRLVASGSLRFRQDFMLWMKKPF